MAAVLAPWPFLDGGAMAVVVATVFDGATVEQELLWRGGARTVARLANDDVAVRLGSGGFELLLPRSCDGEVAVGARVVALRELSVCGVTVLPLGTRTRVTVRMGTLTFVIAGTTPPRKLPLGPAGSWRRRVATAATATAVALFALAVQVTTPRVPTWTVPETVRVKVAMMWPSLQGGRAATVVRDVDESRTKLRPPSVAGAAGPQKKQARPRQRQEQQQQQQRAQQAKELLAQQQQPAAEELESQPQARHEPQPQEPQPARLELEPSEDEQTGRAQHLEPTEAQRPRASASAELASLDRLHQQRAREDDARQAAALQARAAGVVGAMAQLRASFLGDVHVVAAEVADTGSVAIGAGDASSATGAAGSPSGAAGVDHGAAGVDRGASGGSGSGSGSGASDGSGDPLGTLEGDEIGEAYGVGGLGLTGTGVGGGGSGDGTIGIGCIGTIGYGGGSGSGYGYGRAAGGLGGRRASVPVALAGLAEVRGSCDKDLIRRVVRAHVNELRFCYERALQSRPELAGRVVSRFVIGFDGRVSSSTIASSTISAGVDSCVAQAIARWQFVPRCVGEVSYPFVFESASAP